ncbi:MAG: hypothetical protein GY791_05465 [Alphaproteobacteria bacterium]|nr:hypothetical protein [Alphaproteobacteria bacterium]
MGRSAGRGKSGLPGRRFHLLALGLLLAVVAGWLALMLIAARDAELSGERSGMVTTVFPVGASLKEAFLATDRAGGSIVAGTWFPNIWVLYSDQPGYAGRLRAAGAILVFDSAPFQSMTIPTCGGV